MKIFKKLLEGANLRDAGQDIYNNAVDTVKRVDGIGSLTLDDLYRRFQDMETPLGTVWMSNVSMIKEPCMIFGPGKDEEFIYIQQKKDSFIISYCDTEAWLEASDEELEEHRCKPASPDAENVEKILCYATDSIALVNEIYKCVDAFVHDKAENRTLEHSKDTSIRYRFDEEFSLLGQKFSLCEMDGTKVYDVKGTIPLKTFHIYEAGTDHEVLSITKKLLHVMPRYEFYEGKTLIGKFQKKVDILRDTFEMNLPEGKLVMSSVGQVFGENYVVKINERVIGTIANNLNLNLNNIIYDNYVINVNDEKYKLLMVGLGVMAARELARDEDKD